MKANVSKYKGKCRSSSKKQNKFKLLGIWCFAFIISERFQLVAALGKSRLDSTEFSRYSIIKPRIIIHGQHKHVMKNTLENSGLHADHIQLSYEHNNKDVILDLHLNNDLLPKNHFISTQHSNGSQVVKTFTKTDVEFCHYNGKILNHPASFVALSTCDGIKGVVNDGKNTYYIENESVGINRTHYLIPHSDLNHQPEFEESSNKLSNDNQSSRAPRYKRSVDPNQIQPVNENHDSRFVELLIVVDNKVFNSLKKDVSRTHQHCKDIANIVNALYSPLNIFVALIGVVIWSEKNLVELSGNSNTTLDNFLKYRADVLVKDHPNDNAQLLTGESFEAEVVGKASWERICSSSHSGGIIADKNILVAGVASTIAHELGHNLGMEHDKVGCECPDDRCIMAEKSASAFPPLHWSSCSKDQVKNAFKHGLDSCLKNKPKKLFESPHCGNGFIEPGEECDCGLREYCKNPCCNPDTCMLFANATCATGVCCDLMTCQLRSAGTVCRDTFGECDLPEYCDGEQEFCPNDVFKTDGEDCDSNKAYCYQGSCTSHNNQCNRLWGPKSNSLDPCYNSNLKGDQYGHCGFNRDKKKYIPCQKYDVFCGVLHCEKNDEKPEVLYGKDVTYFYTTLSFGSKTLKCISANIDLGLQVEDPGLVPNGAKCGSKTMCLNQACVSTERVKAGCPNCYGNGVCNSKGHCHCFDGYDPPDCRGPGFGGSIDSGPPGVSDSRNNLVKIMYIFFLGVVPFCAIIAIAIQLKREKSQRLPQKPSEQIPSSAEINSANPLMNNNNLQRIQKTQRDQIRNEIIGEFKGFTLKPLAVAKETANHRPHIAPVREAPPPPKQQPGINSIINKFNHMNQPSTSSNVVVPSSNSLAKAQPVRLAPPPPPPPKDY